MSIKCFLANLRIRVSRLEVWSLFLSIHAQPTSAATTIDQFVRTVRKTFMLAQGLMVYVAYSCGMAFTIMGLFKIKAHRDNPAQIPLSTALVLLGVGACLMFLPSFLELVGSAFFDNAAQPGTPLSKTLNF